MTDAQKIDFVATNVMEWRKEKSTITDNWWWRRNSDNYGMYPVENIFHEDARDMSFKFDPLKDWNHWRQVEIQMMKDEKLFTEYAWTIAEAGQNSRPVSMEICESDLPTRCTALITAHKSLYGQ